MKVLMFLRKYAYTVLLAVCALSFAACSDDDGYVYRVGDDYVPDDYCEIMSRRQIPDYDNIIMCGVIPNVWINNLNQDQIMTLLTGDWVLMDRNGDMISITINRQAVSYTYKNEKHSEKLQNFRVKDGFCVAKIAGIGNVAVSGGFVLGGVKNDKGAILSAKIISDSDDISQLWMDRLLSEEEALAYCKEFCPDIYGRYYKDKCDVAE